MFPLVITFENYLTQAGLNLVPDLQSEGKGVSSFQARGAKAPRTAVLLAGSGSETCNLTRGCTGTHRKAWIFNSQIQPLDRPTDDPSHHPRSLGIGIDPLPLVSPVENAQVEALSALLAQ